MTSKSTDPGIARTEPSSANDAAVTDPSDGGNASTEPGARPASAETTDPQQGDSLLEGLRRDRPPPRLSPRINAASEGGEAVAYYAGPQSVPARFDTPPLEAAIEIATTPAAPTTQPLAGALRPNAPLAPAKVLEARGPETARVLEETVPARRKSTSRRHGLLVALVVLFGASLALWYALRMGREPALEPTSLASAPPPPPTSSPSPSIANAASAMPGRVASPGAEPDSSPAVRMDATASAPRPNMHPSRTDNASASPVATGRELPRPAPPPGPSPAAAPSAEPRPIVSPPPATSTKVDHVRSI